MNYTLNEVKILEKNNLVLGESLKETKRKNEPLIEHFVQKEIEISQLKSEVADAQQHNNLG